MPEVLSALETTRTALLREIFQLGDFRLNSSGCRSDSWLSRWSTVRKRVDRQSSQRRGPGGIHPWALYRCARSVTAVEGLRQFAPHSGRAISLPPRPHFPRPLRAGRQCRRFRMT